MLIFKNSKILTVKFFISKELNHNGKQEWLCQQRPYRCSSQRSIMDTSPIVPWKKGKKTEVSENMEGVSTTHITDRFLVKCLKQRNIMSKSSNMT